MWNAFKDHSRWTTALHSSAMVNFAVNFIDLSYLTREHSYITLQYPASHLGMSKNGVYSQWNSHLIGIMISKTIGFRATQHFQTHPSIKNAFRCMLGQQISCDPDSTHLLQLTQRQTLCAHPVMATKRGKMMILHGIFHGFWMILGCSPTAWSFSVSRPRSFQDSWFNPWSKARMVICYL